jgi:hypothetical protein
MNRTILYCMIILSIHSLYAGSPKQEERGFTVTHLMLEIQNIELPQDQTEKDINSSENRIYQNEADDETQLSVSHDI